MSYLINSAFFGKDYAKHSARAKIEKQKTDRAKMKRAVASEKMRSQERALRKKEEEREAKEEEKQERAEEQRRQKEEEKQEKAEAQRRQAEALQRQLEQNRSAFQAYQKYLHDLQKVHTVASEPIDWEEIAGEEAPQKVEGKYKEEAWEMIQKEGQLAVLKKIENYRPSLPQKIKEKAADKWGNTFIGKLARLSKEDPTLQRLHEYYEKSKQADLLRLENLVKQQEEAYAEWQMLQKMARGVLDKNPLSYTEALNYLDNFADMEEYGSRIEIEPSSDSLKIVFWVKSEKVVPQQELILDKNDVLTEKEMPLLKFNEIYQDYVCSCILRIAREIFACLPLSLVHIEAMGNMFDRATGNNEEFAIVSTEIKREALQKLNFDLLDPSDSMVNFNCQMNFDKKKGFGKLKQ